MVRLFNTAPKPVESDARSNLATAISDLDRWKADADQRQKAIAQVQRALGDAITDKEKAEVQLEELRDEVRQRALGQISQVKGGHDPIAEVHSRNNSADFVIAELRANLEAIKQTASEDATILARLQARVDRAVAAVISEEVQAFRDETAKLRDAYARSALRLRYVYERSSISDWPPTTMSSEVEALIFNPFEGAAESPLVLEGADGQAAIADLKEAFDALYSNAAAPLRVVGS